MDERQEIFNKYIEEYKKNDIRSKREKYISSLKELIFIFDGLAEADNIKLEYLKNNEILETETEDDFLEASMVYLEIAKDIIGQYISQK